VDTIHNHTPTNEVNITMKMLKDSKAVSPVIGVMLMLVVTVILAAAVSSTSSGLMKSSDAAPTAAFKVNLYNGSVGSMASTAHLKIEQVSGESIPSKDLKIVTINPNAAGENKTMEVLPGVENACRASSAGTLVYGGMPYLQNGLGGAADGFGKGTATALTKNFGNYTVKSGLVLIADDYGFPSRGTYTAPDWDSSTGDYEGDDNQRTGLQAMFADRANITPGDFVTIKIIHTPTQKVIFQTEVEMED